MIYTTQNISELKSQLEQASENIVVELHFFSSDNNKYQAGGVLAKIEEDYIQIAFNARNNTIIDFLNFSFKDIIDIKIVTP